MLELSQEAKDALLAVLEMIEAEDELLRLEQLREYKKNNLFWHGFQYLFWSEMDKDWRVPSRDELSQVAAREDTRWIFDYVINHFKAHGESIIAALSADVPTVVFGPRDATDPEDNRAVEAADNTVKLIEKWNRAKMLIVEALFYLCNEGFCASYTYNRKDPAYGHYKLPVMGQRMQQTAPNEMICTQCAYSEPVAEEQAGMGEPGEQIDPQMDPENVQGVNDLCPECGAQMIEMPGMEEEVPFQESTKLVPKGREIIEVYGALDVRVPSYARKQADCGYLVHYVDAPPQVFKEAYASVADDISIDSASDYERQMRRSSVALEDPDVNVQLTTLKRCWLRFWELNRLGEAHDPGVQELRSKFKQGIFCCFVNKVFCDARDESMDAHWTITKAGPSKSVHADPLLKSEVPLQEMRNNLTNMIVMQVEFGVPATYADPEVYDFDGQQKAEVAPGYVYPAVPKPGQRVSDAFHTEKTTILAKETMELFASIDQDEQFVNGTFPSIYGGPSSGGSKTLGEYEKSRSYAMQRLSLPYYFLTTWYGETMHKAVQSFVDHQVDDESMTSQKKGGGFATKWIKKAMFKGSFERLEPEATADFPASFAQKRATLMSLLQLGNDTINSVLFSAENAGVIQRYVGLNELKVPMEAQRRKQIRELIDLIQGQPQDNGQGGITSSVAIEPDIDDHATHIEICVDYLCSDDGQDLKKENPEIYANILGHLMEHKQYEMQAMMQQSAQAPQEEPVNVA